MTYDEAPLLDQARTAGELVVAEAGGVAPERIIVPVGVQDRIDHLFAAAIDFWKRKATSVWMD